MNHAWVFNLAQHVEPRRVSTGKTVAWCAIGFCVSLALGLWLASRAT